MADSRSNGHLHLGRLDTLDRAPRLSGTLLNGGIAELAVDARSRANSTNSAASAATGPSEALPSSGEDEDIEDYDAQPLDPDVLVHTPVQELAMSLNDHANGVDKDTGTADSRRKSIPIRLEKMDKRGRYMLHADDVEIKDILRRSAERSKASKRKGVRDLVFTRRFTTFDRRNPSRYESPFHGFFTLFWLGMALLLLRVGAQNWKTYGSVLGKNELLTLMFSRDVLVLGVTDAVMVASTSVGLLWQRLIAAGYIDWGRSGYIIQNLWQTIFLFAFLGFTFYREWPWTHSIFLLLHTMVFVMKQHSYAFYNGYLGQVYHRKKILQRKLNQLKAMTPMSTPANSPTGPSTSPTLPSSPSHSRPTSGHASTSGARTSLNIDGLRDSPSAVLRHRRKSSNKAGISTKIIPKENLSEDTEQIATIAEAISSSTPLTADQMDTFSSIISSELDAVSAELRGKCVVTQNHYPSNLTLANWAEWTCLPTLVYELEYPRQDRINWWYIAEKTAATFGVIAVMMVISQAYIYPCVAATVAMKEAGMPVAERWREFPWVMSDMLFPLLLEQLLTWYVIWECVLNVAAEATRFADRGFYGAWWNSTSWDQYARDWNRPVHNFLLRHVYHSSISAFHLSKTAATFVTFLLSALVHEFVMFVLFKKVRGYLLAMQLLQMPLVALSRTPLLKGRDILGNIVFWIGLFVGPSFLVSLYLVI